jgi:hypothetical protein
VPWVEQHEATNNEVIAVIVGAAMRGMLDAGMSPDEVRGAMEKLLVASIGTNASEQREGVNTRAPDAITGGN